jgi:hypothetical protein
MTVYTNTTPWNLADLEKFLDPHIDGMGIREVLISILEPQPGVAREKQALARIVPMMAGSTTFGPSRRAREDYSAAIIGLNIELLSPKRADKRTNTLDRLSVVEDLQEHEALLTENAIARVLHCLDEIKNRSIEIKAGRAVEHYKFTNHLRGRCACVMPSIAESIIVRGDTTIQTHAGRNDKTLSELENKLAKAQSALKHAKGKRDYYQRTVDRYDERIASAKDRIEKAEARIRKAKAKEAMSVPLEEHTQQ